VAPPVPDRGLPGSVPLAVDPPVAGFELLEGGGVLSTVPDDDEDDPPGTTTVSFSFVTSRGVPGAVAAPPGTTVVVSLRSHADNAKAPTRANR